MTRCFVCDAVHLYAFNVALAVTRLLNAMLGGHPNEALCARAERARQAGSRAAAAFCWCVGLVHRGHCAWSLTPDSPARELWRWRGSAS